MLDQKFANKIKRSIEKNLNKNAEAVSLIFYCKKGVLEKIL